MVDDASEGLGQNDGTVRFLFEAEVPLVAGV